MEPNNIDSENQNEIAMEDKMENTENVIQFPANENEQESPVSGDIESTEAPKAIEDPGNPLTEVSIEQISQLLKQVGEMVKIMETHWTTSKNEFKLTDTHMKQLYQYNEEHRTEMPEGLSEEEQENWDRFNGLDNIPEEKVLEIFGEGHPIIGIQNTQSIDRIKDCVNDFFSWLSALKEYRQIHDAYLELVELEEKKNIDALQVIADQEQDPEKKAKMMESINLYYYRKHLTFLTEPMSDQDKDRIIKAFSDAKKIEYWLKRTQDKLKQLKISTKFILELSQFEKRYLPEKYHKCSNILLLYFMQTAVYSDIGNKDDVGRNKTVCMVFALDGIIRKTWPKELAEKVMENIMAMEDQLIDMVPEPKAATGDGEVNGTSTYGKKDEDSFF